MPQSKNRQLTMIFYLVEIGLIMAFAFRRYSQAANDRNQQGRSIGVLVSLLFVFSMIYCLTHIQVRYRAPMEPVAAVLLGVLSQRPTKKTSPPA